MKTSSRLHRWEKSKHLFGRSIDPPSARRDVCCSTHGVLIISFISARIRFAMNDERQSDQWPMEFRRSRKLCLSDNAERVNEKAREGHAYLLIRPS